MDVLWKRSIWLQFGAAIDTLSDAIDTCPEPLWTAAVWHDEDDPGYGQFWFIAYHTLFWLDLFLTGSYNDFTPPAPFIRGALPETPYSKDDITRYLKQCRQKCETIFAGLTDEKAREVCVFEWMQPTFFELQLYSMRHVQEHAAHLSLFLGQHGISAPDWIAQARST